MFVKMRFVRVTKQSKVCAKPSCFHLQAGKSRFDTEQMPVRQKNAHAAKFDQNIWRSMVGIVTVTWHIKYIKMIECACQILGITHMIAKVENTVGTLSLDSIVHIADRFVRVGKNKNFHRITVANCCA